MAVVGIRTCPVIWHARSSRVTPHPLEYGPDACRPMTPPAPPAPDDEAATPTPLPPFGWRTAVRALTRPSTARAEAHPRLSAANLEPFTDWRLPPQTSVSSPAPTRPASSAGPSTSTTPSRPRNSAAVTTTLDTARCAEASSASASLPGGCRTADCAPSRQDAAFGVSAVHVCQPVPAGTSAEVSATGTATSDVEPSGVPTATDSVISRPDQLSSEAVNACEAASSGTCASEQQTAAARAAGASSIAGSCDDSVRRVALSERDGVTGILDQRVAGAESAFAAAECLPQADDTYQHTRSGEMHGSMELADAASIGASQGTLGTGGSADAGSTAGSNDDAHGVQPAAHVGDHQGTVTYDNDAGTASAVAGANADSDGLVDLAMGIADAFLSSIGARTGASSSDAAHLTRARNGAQLWSCVDASVDGLD